MSDLHNGGEIVAGWTPPPRPTGDALSGRIVRLERMSAEHHAADLYRANSADKDGLIWKYLPYGPFSSAATYHYWVRDMAALKDPFFFVLIDRQTGHAGGIMSLMRIDPNAGSIEVGHINIAPEMQRSLAVSEAIYLLMRWSFESGYRRFEWKCDASNMRSRRAAERFGLSYEGVFRQHTISKGRNRDTAWYAAIDKEWPALKEAYESWLSPRNFDANGQQIESLADLTQLVRVTNDPALLDKGR